MKKTAIILAAILSVMGTSAFAQVESISEVDRDYNKNIMSIKGSAGANEKISIRVLSKSFDLSTASLTDFDVLDEIKADEKGNFSYSFSIAPLKSGEYEAFASGKESENKSIKFYYGISDEVQETVDKIKNAKTVDELEKILTNSESTAEEQKNNVGNLMLDNEVFNSVSKKNVAQKLIKNISSTSNIDDIKNEIMKTALLECYNEGKKAIVFDSNNNFKYDDFTELSKLDANKGISAYSEFQKLTAQGKSEVVDLLLNNSYASFEDMYKDFAAAVIVKSMGKYETKGFDHVTSILEKNAGFAQISIGNYSSQSANTKNKINSYLVLNGASITNRETFKTYFDNAMDEYKEDVSAGGNNGSSTGSGGGSSSGSGGYNSYQAFPNAIQNEQKTVEFSDVASSHWANEAIVFIGKRGIINGSDGKFRPEDYIKREEFVKIVAETFGLTSQSNKSDFADVKDGAWYTKYINAAVENNVVNGVDKNNFGIGENIKREDVAVIIARTLQNLEKSVEKKTDVTFDDADKISDYAKAAVETMSVSQIMNGMDNNKFEPKGLCTRAQAAQIMYNVIKALGM